MICSSMQINTKGTLGQRFFNVSISKGLTSSGGGGSAAPHEGRSGSGASGGLIKHRFMSFNMQFEELHEKESHRTVPNTELRESLRLAIAEA